MIKDPIERIVLSEFYKWKTPEDCLKWIKEDDPDFDPNDRYLLYGMYNVKLSKKDKEKFDYFKQFLEKHNIYLLAPNETYLHYINIPLTIDNLKKFSTLDEFKQAALEENNYLYQSWKEKRVGHFGNINKLRFVIETPKDEKGNELFNAEELTKLVETYKMLLEENCELVFKVDHSGEYYSVNEAILASRRVNEIIDKEEIKKLSPYERYLYAYDFVTSFIYHEVDKRIEKNRSRELIPILNGDRIVCVGFASMLRELCNRLDIPCIEQGVDSDHQVCVVRLDDEKYNIHGIYFSDPTNDCAAVFQDGKLEKLQQGFKYSTIFAKDFLKSNFLSGATIKKPDKPEPIDDKLRKLKEILIKKDIVSETQVAEYLFSSNKISKETCARGYINTLLSQKFPEDEIVERCKVRNATFCGTNTEYSVKEELSPKL